MQRKCPTCRRVIDDAAAAATRPFCSERCRTADLGGWLDGAYRIASPIREDDLDHGVPAMDDDGNELGRRQ
jgi:endogenous inhibitor of DNA gyrase (YacG/DUF329 family)